MAKKDKARKDLMQVLKELAEVGREIGLTEPKHRRYIVHGDKCNNFRGKRRKSGRKRLDFN